MKHQKMISTALTVCILLLFLDGCASTFTFDGSSAKNADSCTSGTIWQHWVSCASFRKKEKMNNQFQLLHASYKNAILAILEEAK